MHKTKFLLFIQILAISLIVSLLFLNAQIDQDFFSFYYTGRGITYGQDLFRDFANNKGPVVGYVFALFYFIFGSNYRLGLVVTTGIVDAVAVFFLYQITQYYFPIANVKKHPLFLLLSLLLYKSFTLGNFISSLYSESIALLFLLISIYLFHNRKYLLSGLLFAAGILSRQTLFFFLPVFFLFGRIKLTTIPTFLSGSFIGTLLILLPFLNTEALPWVYQNMVAFNLHYRETVTNQVVSSFLNVIQVEPKIIFMFLVCFLSYLLFVTNSANKHKLLITAILVISIYPILSGGIVYGHHFHYLILPFCLLLSFTLSSYPQISLALLLPLFLSLGLHYYLNMTSSKYSSLSGQQLDQVTFPNKYALVVNYYPEIYFYLNKEAPDRYYQYFFTLPHYNKHNQKDVQLHRQLSLDKLQQTDFVFVINDTFDLQMANSYLDLFQGSFCLKQTQKTKTGLPVILIYQSVGCVPGQN